MSPLRLVALSTLAAGIGCGSSATGSVGAVFTRDADTRSLVVREAPELADGAPPELRAGDQVLMIDGWYVRDLPSKDVRAKLRGEVGTTVRLTIVRNGDEVHHLVIKRTELGARRAAAPKEERLAE
jgi:C-terminal processing protease CtpA/Prc